MPQLWRPYTPAGRGLPERNSAAGVARGLALWCPYHQMFPALDDRVGRAAGTWGASPAGATTPFGAAPAFTGTGGYLDYGRPPAAQFPAQMTVACWVQLGVATQDAALVGWWNTGGGTDNNFLLYVGQDVANGGATFQVQQSNNTFAAAASTSTTLLTAGVMTLLVGVADGSFLRLYCQGVAVATPTSYNGTLNTASTLHLIAGRLRTLDTLYSLTGNLAAIALWNRPLSAAEVWQLYDPATRWDLYQPRRQLPAVSPAVVLQTAAPISDISAGGWRGQDGGVLNLYSYVDEPGTPNDSDYLLSSPNPTSDQAELQLGAVTDPGVDTGHTLRIRRRQR